MSDYSDEAAAGRIPGVTPFTMRGYALNPPTTGQILLWESLTDYVFLVAPAAYELVSDSANDAAAGTGARAIAVTTLDGNYNEVVSIVVPNGVTAVPLPGTHQFLNGAQVVDSGGTHANVGNISIRVSPGGILQGFIAAGAGNSRAALYTVPAGKRFQISSYILSAALPGNAGAGCRFIAMNRLPSGTIIQGAPQNITSNGPLVITAPIITKERISLLLKLEAVSIAQLGVSFAGYGFVG